MRRPCPQKSLNRLLLPLLCCLALLGALGADARAVSAVEAQIRPDTTIVIDGVERIFYNVDAQQVHPILYNGTTYLPVRAIGELMGKNVGWYQDTKTVTLSGVRTDPPVTGVPDAGAQVEDISAQLRDDFTIVVDGVTRTFADANGSRVYPLLYSGSTYLPVRAIGELMGKTVSWDGNTRTVSLDGDSLVTDADFISGGTPAGPAGAPISPEEAKAAAPAHAGLAGDAVTFVQVELEWDDGRQIYEIEFYAIAGYQEYDYEIDALTGEIRSFDFDAEHAAPPASGDIGRDRAREIALGKVPGADESHVVKLKQDRDDGRLLYEVEIVYSGTEYELEIDAGTGAVLKFEAEPV